MKFENFKKSLESEILPAYFIAGEDIFLMYKTLGFLEDACVPQYKELNYTIYDVDSKNTIEEIIDCLNGVPLMDKKRLVVLKGSSLKKNQLNAKALEAYLKNPNLEACFVYFDTNQNELFYAYKSFFEVVDCNKLTKPLTKKFIEKELQKYKRTILDEAFDLLYENCDGLLSKLMQEIKKLIALSNNVITLDLVENNTEKTLEFQVFELSDALSKRQKQKVLTIFNKLLLDRSSKEAIIPVLSAQFNRALHSKLNSDVKLVSKELKVKEYAVIKAREMAESFSQKELKKICDILSKFELGFKSGKISLDNALSCLTLELLQCIQ